MQSNPELKKISQPKVSKYIPWQLTTKQEAFLWLTNKDVFYGGAAGGGKSVALLAAALQFVDYENYDAILLRDTYANLTKPKALMDLADSWLVGTDAVWDGEDRKWVFPSGATLSFGYLDGPRDHFNYQSAAYQFVGIDEIVNIRENQALYMYSRMRKIEGSPIPIRFRAASNPPAPEQVERGSWVKVRYIDPETRFIDPFTGEKSIFIPSKLEDNPHLDYDDYVQSLNFLDPVTREQLLNGDWNIQISGNMFKRDWIRVEENITGQIVKLIRYWDLAATEKKENNNPAYTSGALLARTDKHKYYLLNIVRFQGSPGRVENVVYNTAVSDGKEVEVCMEQEPGSGGKNTIHHYKTRILAGWTFTGDKVTGSKVERARALSSQTEAGNFVLVKGRWNQDWIEEAVLFPNSVNKDQIDSTAGGFNKLAASGHFRSRIV